MEDLLAEQDENLASYKAQLQKAGEEIFAEKKGELRRARAQKLQNAIRALQEKMALELKERQEDLNREVCVNSCSCSWYPLIQRSSDLAWDKSQNCRSRWKRFKP